MLRRAPRRFAESIRRPDSKNQRQRIAILIFPQKPRELFRREFLPRESISTSVDFTGFRVVFLACLEARPHICSNAASSRTPALPPARNAKSA